MARIDRLVDDLGVGYCRYCGCALDKCVCIEEGIWWEEDEG